MMRTLYKKEWLVIAVILVIMLSVSLISILNRNRFKIPSDQVEIIEKAQFHKNLHLQIGEN